MKKFLASYQRNIKNELLSRLAYHDGFVFISTKPDIETVFMNASKKMMDNLGCITDGNNIVPITAAMGYTVQNDNSTKDINEIIREAEIQGCMRKALYEASEGLVHFTQSSILPF